MSRLDCSHQFVFLLVPNPKSQYTPKLEIDPKYNREHARSQVKPGNIIANFANVLYFQSEFALYFVFNIW